MQLIDSLKSTLTSTDDPINYGEMVLYRDIAMFYAWIGEVDETLDWMERAVSWSHHAIDFRYIDSGIFDKVREDSSFRSGLQSIRDGMMELLREAAG